MNQSLSITASYIVHVLKSLEPLVTAIVSWITMRSNTLRRGGATGIFLLLLVSFGAFMLMFVGSDNQKGSAVVVSSSLEQEISIGAVPAIISALLMASRNVVMKQLLGSSSSLSTSSARLLYVTFGCAALIILGFVLVLMPFLSPTTRLLRTSFQMIATSATFFALYNISSMLVLMHVPSAQVHAVLNAVKRVLIILVSIVVFRNALSLARLFGASIILISAFLYLYLYPRSTSTSTTDVDNENGTAEDEVEGPGAAGHLESFNWSRLRKVSFLLLFCLFVSSYILVIEQPYQFNHTKQLKISSSSSFSSSPSLSFPFSFASKERRLGALFTCLGRVRRVLERQLITAVGRCAETNEVFMVKLPGPYHNNGDRLRGAGELLLLAQGGFNVAANVRSCMWCGLGKESNQTFESLCGFDSKAKTANSDHSFDVAQVCGAGQRYGVFVFDGGGDMGNIYSTHSSCRMQYVKRILLEREFFSRVVFFPLQPSYSLDDAGLAFVQQNVIDYAEMIKRHRKRLKAASSLLSLSVAKSPPLTLFARTLAAQRFLRKHFSPTVTSDVLLAPDAAFYFGPMPFELHASSLSILFMLRYDSESAFQQNGTLTAHDVNVLLRRTMSSVNKARISRGLQSLSFARGVYKTFQSEFQQRHTNASDYNVLDQGAMQGLGIVSNAHVVVTDLLHVSIMSVMIGRPVIFVDNRAKKISRALHVPFSACTASERQSLAVFQADGSSNSVEHVALMASALYACEYEDSCEDGFFASGSAAETIVRDYGEIDWQIEFERVNNVINVGI